jgi:membrane-associated phospholipid phosphatase
VTKRRAPGGDVGARVVGLPLDRLFAIYLAVAAAALLFPHRPAAWPLLLAVHLLLVLLLWPLLPVERVIQQAGESARGRLRAVLDWAPLLLVPVLYTELALLNQAVHGGRYFDDIVIGWEQVVFGGQPNRDWAAALPSLWLSEPLHFAYLSYYFIIFVPPLLLFLRGRRDAFRFGVFAVMLSFFLHYLFFIYFPVQGPRYLFDPHGGEMARGLFYGTAHSVLEAGSSQGAAFPSSHVGVSVTQTLVVLRFLPRLTPLIGILTVGLAFGAIYGGFHYAIDAVVGLAVGAIAYAIAAPLLGRLAPAASAGVPRT